MLLCPVPKNIWNQPYGVAKKSNVWSKGIVFVVFFFDSSCSDLEFGMECSGSSLISASVSPKRFSRVGGPLLTEY